LSALNTKQKALGFVESLIAIAVTGIACIVLMAMAARTIKEVGRNEESDEMLQLAVSGAAMINEVANNGNTSSTAFPPIISNINNCFKISSIVMAPSLSATSVCSYDVTGRDNCKSTTAPARTDLFRVFCITNKSDAAAGVVVGKIIVGKTACEDSVNCDVRDYQYYLVVQTKQW
jgi:hypothetical protein